MKGIKIMNMNCCLVDCAQERLDRNVGDGYSRADIRKFYMEDPETDGITPLISPLSDSAHDSDLGQPKGHKRKQPSSENTPDSLTGAVETTYDESDSDAAYEVYIRELSPKSKAKKSFTDVNKSAEVLKNILTGRDGTVNGRSLKPHHPFAALNPYESCEQYAAKHRNDMKEKKDWWTVI